MTKQYKVGIYCRLSVDDASNSAKAKHYIPSEESVSIENQYEILSKFAMLNGWIEVKTYRDDGYSGGNFQRPGFLEMLEDARHGLINLILVKDLSRLGRDFVEVGRYTDVVFPSLGCRFVSVLDCLDSEGDNTDMLHFRSLMNDYHLKDLSSKIRSVLHAKKKSGQYVAAYAPYGYRKSEEDKHRLVLDEEAAAVVREIYQMRYSGMAYGKIAATLNGRGILPPSWHWAVHYGNRSTSLTPGTEAPGAAGPRAGLARRHFKRGRARRVAPAGLYPPWGASARPLGWRPGGPAGPGVPAGTGPTINDSSPLLPCWEPHYSTASRVCTRRSRPATHPAGGHIRKPPASSPAAALRRAVPLFCVGPALDCAVLLRHCPTGQKGVQRHVYRNHSRRSRHPRQLHLRTPAMPTRKSQPRPRTGRSTQAVPRQLSRAQLQRPAGPSRRHGRRRYRPIPYNVQLRYAGSRPRAHHLGRIQDRY